MGFITGVFLALVFFAWHSVTNLIFYPFETTLVRYRANYNPKVSSRNGRAIGPVLEVDGYFSMMKRINQVEGLSGFLKGFMPTLLDGLLHSIVGIVAPLFLFSYNKDEDRSLIYLHSYCYQTLLTAVFIPLSIIINRAICTPYFLSSGSYRSSLSVLLSSSERRQPWRLYLSPGVLIVVLVPNLLDLVLHFYVNPVRFNTDGNGMSPQSKWWRIPTAVLRIFINTPFDVVFIRLSLQRYFAGDNQERDGSASEVAGARKYSSYADVIRLRQEPYTSLYNCVVKMAQEEGWTVFYRGLLWTLLRFALSWLFGFLWLSGDL